MTVESLKQSGYIVFECISGSRAYGLSTPASDTDIRGVYILPPEQFYSLEYPEQISNETNDITYYELRRFVELCAANNPNILELLNVPEHCVLYRHPIFEQLTAKLFLSKKCEASFANYAYAQIKKARGLEKKIVNPVDKVRKSILDFCWVLDLGRSKSLLEFLKEHQLTQENCGLSSIPHLRDCFNLYHSKSHTYQGICRKEGSNEVSLSDIPKGESPLAMMYFNKDGYSTYCKRYREYWDWVEKRNQERYNTTISHGKNYDSKNLMHTFRLLHMAREIALEGKIHVERPDRAFLLDIKAGKFEYDKLVTRAEDIKNELTELFAASTLPDQPDLKKINEVLVEMRSAYYRFEE